MRGFGEHSGNLSPLYNQRGGKRVQQVWQKFSNSQWLLRAARAHRRAPAEGCE